MTIARRYAPNVISDRRTIVNGANAHLERPVSGATSLLCKAIHEIRMDVPLAQDAGAFSGDAEQIVRARLVDLRECAEDCCNENCAAVMRFGGLPENRGIRLYRLPFAFLVRLPEITAQCVAAS